MAKLDGAPSSPKVCSLPACCWVSGQPTILAHAKISQILHIRKRVNISDIVSPEDVQVASTGLHWQRTQ